MIKQKPWEVLRRQKENKREKDKNRKANTDRQALKD